MADIIITQDPTKPGVLKGNGPTLTAAGDLPLTALSVTGAVNGQAVVLTAGDWAPGNVASSDTASNLGAGSQVFKSKVALDFQFRSIIGGTGITAVQNANDITLTTSTSTSAIVIIADQKAQNTAGGTFTLGAWRTRDLNIELADPDGLATIAANQITLAAGTYRTLIIAPAYKVGDHASRLQNITDATTVLTGTSETTSTADAVTSHSTIAGRFTIAAAKALEVQHQSASTGTTDGFGRQANFQVEQYTTVIFWKE